MPRKRKKGSKQKRHKIINARWSIYSPFKRKGSIFFQVKIRDLRSGRLQWLSTRQTDLRRAEQTAIDWTREQEAREAGAVLQGPDFSTAYNEYLGTKTCRPVTLEGYRMDFDGVYKPAFEGKLLPEIEFADVEAFISDLAKKGSSARTRAKHLTAIRSFLRWARLRNYVASNVAEGVKAGPGNKKEAWPITLAEMAKLLAAAREKTVKKIQDHRRGEWEQSWTPPEHLFLALALACYTGARRRSIHELTWRSVDLARGEITFPPEIMKKGRELRMPIHPALDRVLRAALRGRRKVSPGEPVVGEKIGNTAAALHGACRRAGLPEIGWHSLRHSFATAMAERSSFAVLQALLGHAPPNVTAHYTHPRWQDLVDAVGKLPDLIGAAPAAAPGAGAGTSR